MKLMPSLPSCVARMTSGERRLAERLLQKLEDDYSGWYNVPIGEKQFYPDFIILNPKRGILVLEVKDWKLETIRGADRYQMALLTQNGLTKTANPLEQARLNALRVETLLRSDPALRNPQNHPRYPGKLIMPFGWGAVLANITRKQFESQDLGQVLEPSRVICQDEMTESVDAEAFQSRLWGMFNYKFERELHLPEIERVRWHLFPELRLSTQQGQFGLLDGESTNKVIEIPDLIKIMDINQENLARSLGEGHRVIHGVAGSGKSMILGFRCLQLARTMSKPILVLCYNVTLAARLKQVIAERGAGERVSVRSFHEWCRDMLTTYQVDRPKFDRDYT
ncbi:MAG: NERD domain-containing protein, partial [Kiritimatiellae bacterium]|nr:NERD domain-containing protein [Kiritimatiellia bacterium]